MDMLGGTNYERDRQPNAEPHKWLGPFDTREVACDQVPGCDLSESRHCKP